jgi:hypothetical protein
MLALRGENHIAARQPGRKKPHNTRYRAARRRLRSALQRNKRRPKDASATFRKPTLF